LFLACIVALGMASTGCRRNLLRVETTPPGAYVFIEGRRVQVEDSNRNLARKIDRKKEKGRALTEAELDFQGNRKKLQTTPVEYEFGSVACGYTIYCKKKGYQSVSELHFLKPKWYEYPPIDLLVDLLPVTVTDRREISVGLDPETSPSTQSDGG